MTTMPQAPAGALPDDIDHDFAALAMTLRRMASAEPTAAASAALASAAATVTATAARLTADLTLATRDRATQGTLTARLSPLEVGDLNVDRTAHVARMAGVQLPLTPKEFAILAVLASDPSRLFAKAELHRAVWGDAITATSSRTLEGHIARLRVKLGGRPWIQTVQGHGWRLRPVALMLPRVADEQLR